MYGNKPSCEGPVRFIEVAMTNFSFVELSRGFLNLFIYQPRGDSDSPVSAEKVIYEAFVFFGEFGCCFSLLDERGSIGKLEG